MPLECTTYIAPIARRHSRHARRRVRVDARTWLGRRAKELAEGIASQVGGWASLTASQVADVRRAAELNAFAEQVRADVLRQGAVLRDIDAVLRLEGLAARSTRQALRHKGQTHDGP